MKDSQYNTVYYFNNFALGWNAKNFADDIYKCIFSNENFDIFNFISLESALVWVQVQGQFAFHKSMG